METIIETQTLKQGIYGEYWGVPEAIKELISLVEKNNVCKTGIVNHSRNRGASLNIDVYGFDQHQNLAVIQVRLCEFRKRGFNSVRKDYYLIGLDSTVKKGINPFFAHPIPSCAKAAKKAGLEDPKMPVNWALSKIWNCKISDLAKIKRQGDIALLPVKTVPKSAIQCDQSLVLRSSHLLIADEIYKSGDKFYAVNPRLEHKPNEHKIVKAKGVFRVLQGLRSEVWGFSKPTVD